MLERCIALAWCSGCRIYSSDLVYIPRKRVLVDAVASLSPEQRERLLRSETRLIAFLDRQTRVTGGLGQAACYGAEMAALSVEDQDGEQQQ